MAGGELAERLDALLRELCEVGRGVSGAVLISADGLILAEHLPSGLDAELVIGAALRMLRAEGQASVSLDGSEVSEMFVRAERGYLALVLGPRGVRLLALGDEDAKLVSIQLALGQARERLSFEMASS